MQELYVTCLDCGIVLGKITCPDNVNVAIFMLQCPKCKRYIGYGEDKQIATLKRQSIRFLKNIEAMGIPEDQTGQED